MNGKSLHIKSFGCQMNKLDTALVTSALKESGFVLTDVVADADVVLINTCSVRQHAEQRVLSHLGHLKHIKETRPDMVVGVIGCMAQRLGAELLKHAAVDLVCGPGQIPQIVKMLEKTMAEKEKMLAVAEKIRQEDVKNEDLENFEAVYDSDDKQLSNQAFVRVMRGCNKFCTYCIVPYVRGAEACRSPKVIIEQIRRLADRGVKLVTLLGQTVNSYKYSAGEKLYSLADLLYMANEVEGIEWVRFVTSYPMAEFYDEILKAMTGCEKVCKYLHLPAQSGSDRILKAMNRHYTAGQYLEMIERAREIVPQVQMAGDFIVGFPGETDEDFAQTIQLVERAKYKNCFVFKYSPRPGTTADKRLQDDVAQEVKKKKNIELLAVQSRISDELSRGFLGQTVKVLVEGLSKKPHLDAKNGGNVQLVGRTAEDWIVVFEGRESMAGQFAAVKITRTSPLTLFGNLA